MNSQFLCGQRYNFIFIIYMNYCWYMFIHFFMRKLAICNNNHQIIFFSPIVLKISEAEGFPYSIGICRLQNVALFI